MVTTTSTVGISTTMTETSTKFVLGFCVSQLDGTCSQKAQYHQPYYPSLHEKIMPRDGGAFLYNPSAVEKYISLDFFLIFEDLIIQNSVYSGWK